ncbi:cytochrome b/b6 domain-containing protein [Rheinheimera maricola]|uniref:Cytochrome b/b6 domain-containing protein n=1 Tax=Rheinheimera maricola TaxID=2793282 RepID=A0ABS7X9T4_9GAMM|nr:cytochrome b/b6 domain-containing protein [Rheinheimera maricola]MBZ9612081.1 cytochrome b/b6 domain-containing protein [Rheinheimera maricola]
MSQKVKVWDLAVRFFHWSQLLLIAGLWYTGEEGLTAQHQLLAYTLLALVITRIVWGFAGSDSARFARFAATPTAAVRYLRKPYAVTGHNPASFYMIILLISLVLLQLLTGLATFDNSYMSDGPLVAWLPANWVELASDIHKININILLAAIAVHVVAALWHSFRVHNVLTALFTGKDKTAVHAVTLRHSGWFFLLFAALLALLYYWQGSKLMALL